VLPEDRSSAGSKRLLRLHIIGRKRWGQIINFWRKNITPKKQKSDTLSDFLLPCPVKVIQKNLVEAQAPRRSGDAYPASKKDVLGKLEN